MSVPLTQFPWIPCGRNAAPFTTAGGEIGSLSLSCVNQYDCNVQYNVLLVEGAPGYRAAFWATPQTTRREDGARPKTNKPSRLWRNNSTAFYMVCTTGTAGPEQVRIKHANHPANREYQVTNFKGYTGHTDNLISYFLDDNDCLPCPSHYTPFAHTLPRSLSLALFQRHSP